MSREADGIDYPARRRRFRGAYVTNNYDRTLAEETIAEGNADLISFGRPFIANPDLAERMRTDAPLAEATLVWWERHRLLGLAGPAGSGRARGRLPGLWPYPGGLTGRSVAEREVGSSWRVPARRQCHAPPAVLLRRGHPEPLRRPGRSCWALTTPPSAGAASASRPRASTVTRCDPATGTSSRRAACAGSALCF